MADQASSSAFKRYRSHKEDSPLSLDDRLHYLHIIKRLAPTLYKQIIKNDPTGEKHFDITSSASPYLKVGPDGLPIIVLNPSVQKEFSKEEPALFAHELCHYLLGHLEKPSLIHKNISLLSSEKNSEFFSNAYRRIQEYEADRCAALVFGIPVEDIISGFKHKMRWERALWGRNHDRPEKNILFKHHPSDIQRIKALQEVDREAEIQALSHNPLFIDWNFIRLSYLKQTLKDIKAMTEEQVVKKEGEAHRFEAFPEDEYQLYLELVSEIDPEIFRKIINYERLLRTNPIQKVLSGKPTVLIPQETTNYYPLILLPSIQSLSRSEQIEYLKPFIDSYKALSIPKA